MERDDLVHKQLDLRSIDGGSADSGSISSKSFFGIFWSIVLVTYDRVHSIPMCSCVGKDIIAGSIG